MEQWSSCLTQAFTAAELKPAVSELVSDILEAAANIVSQIDVRLNSSEPDRKRYELPERLKYIDMLRTKQR